MKRFVVIIAVAVILYSMYYDIRFGTLPASTNSSNEIQETMVPVNTKKAKSPHSYFEKKVVTGDTVLSIIEEQFSDSIPVPISNVISDFEKLNNGLAPHEIQPGKTYKFPDYQKKSSAE